MKKKKKKVKKQIQSKSFGSAMGVEEKRLLRSTFEAEKNKLKQENKNGCLNFAFKLLSSYHFFKQK
jgi:hypothetical protein